MAQRSEINSVRFCKIRPLRGLITDRYGNVLVDNQPSFDIVFTPDKNRDLKVVTGRLQSLYREQSLQFTEDFNRLYEEKTYAPIRLDKNVDAKKLALVET
ncbi:MAG TPA: hypothetical protein PK653_03435, partial [Syntrophales bacterium]|nr:hypothetical protein [Syntrophales bacterium]